MPPILIRDVVDMTGNAGLTESPVFKKNKKSYRSKKYCLYIHKHNVRVFFFEKTWLEVDIKFFFLVSTFVLFYVVCGLRHNLMKL